LKDTDVYGTVDDLTEDEAADVRQQGLRAEWVEAPRAPRRAPAPRQGAQGSPGPVVGGQD
jgi:hypothetical protein